MKHPLLFTLIASIVITMGISESSASGNAAPTEVLFTPKTPEQVAFFEAVSRLEGSIEGVSKEVSRRWLQSKRPERKEHKKEMRGYLLEIVTIARTNFDELAQKGISSDDDLAFARILHHISNRYTDYSFRVGKRNGDHMSVWEGVLFIPESISTMDEPITNVLKPFNKVIENPETHGVVKTGVFVGGVVTAMGGQVFGLARSPFRLTGKVIHAQSSMKVKTPKEARELTILEEDLQYIADQYFRTKSMGQKR